VLHYPAMIAGYIAGSRHNVAVNVAKGLNMREGCWDCVTKHVSQAMILHEEEVPMGYPQHIKRVVGHLAEASSEVLEFHAELANLLREYRLLVMAAVDYYPPYQKILDFVDLAIECENNKLDVPGVPEDLKIPDKV